MKCLLVAVGVLLTVSTGFTALPPNPAFVMMHGAGVNLPAIDEVISKTADGGGHIYHVMPVRSAGALSGACLIGTVLPGQEPIIMSLPFVTNVLRGPVDPGMVVPMGEEAVFAANAWNFMLDGGGEEPPIPGVEMPPDDALGPLVNGELPPEGRTRPAALDAKFPSGNAPMSAGQFQTSEFMIGRVAIGVILPESSGNGESWSNTDPLNPGDRRQLVYNRIVSAASWWGTSGATAANLTFFYDQQFNRPTSYEPITISTANNGETLWIGDVLGNMGYSGIDAFAQAYSYDNAIRSQYSTDWAFAIFVADSLNDADGNFPNGTCAFAYLHGPYMVMTYDNDGWGLTRMHLVCSHEMGHTFGAPDEYAGAWTCECSGLYGYLGVNNGNCASCTGNQVTCVMDSNTQQLCTFTKSHVGWRDSDSDGILDPVDCQLTFPSAYLDYFIQPWWGKSQIEGHGSAKANPWQSPTRTSVSINHVMAYYDVDSTGAVLATPRDGAFDSDNEAFDFKTATQSDGGHGVAITATDNYGNTGSAGTLGVMIDTTPPPAPSPPVIVAEAPYSANPAQCTVQWNPGPGDPESGTAGHQVSIWHEPQITIQPVATQYVPMPMIQHQFTGLSLTHATSYKAYVQAVNAAGVRGPVVLSSVLTIDLTPPAAPATMSDSGAGTSFLDRLTFSWSAASEDVSGIANYRLYIHDDLNNWILQNHYTGPVTNYTATGLTLTYGRKYFGQVFAVNGANVSGLPSPESDGIFAATTLPDVSQVKKTASLGQAVLVSNVYVSCSGTDAPGVIYAQQSDRSCGIRTDSSDAVSQGQCVEIAGILQLNPQNELYLHDAEVTALTGTQPLKPLSMMNSLVGGAAFGLQPGVIFGAGLNNVGLYVQTWGRVNYVTPAPPYYFVVDDGSGCIDQTGLPGIGCRSGNITPPANGSYVKVRGLCSYESGYPVILLRQSGDWN